MEHQYSQSEEFIRYALDSAAIVAVTDVTGTITFVNSKFCEISGYTEQELIGGNHRILKSGVHDGEFFRAMYRHIAKGQVWHGEICNRRKDGSLYWVDTTIVPHVALSGKVDSYTAIRFDITQRKLIEEELRASKEELDILASTDPLTELPNRREFYEKIDEFFSQPQHAQTFHLALLDIDDFKEINDSFGHAIGDDLLKIISERIQSISQNNCFIARIGGDEFGFIVQNKSSEEVDAFLETVLEHLRDPIKVGHFTRRYSASIGIAAYPADGNSASTLFKAADMALYRAKNLGRDRVASFNIELKETAERRSQTLSDIEDGLRNGEFCLFYQPVIPIHQRQGISLEALMRWYHPTRGLLTPGHFIEALQDRALSATLGLFTLEKVFNDVSQMRHENIHVNRVAINLTNSDFRSETFVDRFFELCHLHDIPPTQFCVEVTEGMFLGRDQKRVHSGLRRLHEAGVEVALDDFGTGFASLTHLRQLPIDRLKIDRSFISNIVTSEDDLAIVDGIIHIAHRMGKVVVAEGVETAEQVELLRKLQCDFLQGWHFSKACPLGHLSEILSSLAPSSLHP